MSSVSTLLKALVHPARFATLRATDVLRAMIPPHIRFVRAGKAFLADGKREVHLLPKLVQPGTTAIDVGAHIGDYTYALCRHLGNHGRVIAIEPIPDLARRLDQAVRRLGLPVTVLN